ncbi:hypothetical protein ATI61_104220 [Archangium gephyra]|uniref:RanBP2-type domain-containing protein n=1 Tax=Archangium gephyra TaxID=48 RepID=A0AAC8TC35_9BACT|nr:hypothetical protein [Archangium gephyra]AKJ00373.1 Hypothetical protein AA314_01999 [Archangium gephyra]REG32930.1 hypothetical protein ATI61_104220 [Archangium gephyra]
MSERHIEMFWRCSSCEHRNLGRHQVCQACKHPKDGSEQYEMPEKTRGSRHHHDERVLDGYETLSYTERVRDGYTTHTKCHTKCLTPSRGHLPGHLPGAPYEVPDTFPAPGAKTPWNLVRFALGGGTRLASRRSISSPVKGPLGVHLFEFGLELLLDGLERLRTK